MTDIYRHIYTHEYTHVYLDIKRAWRGCVCICACGYIHQSHLGIKSLPRPAGLTGSYGGAACEPILFVIARSGKKDLLWRSLQGHSPPSNWAYLNWTAGPETDTEICFFAAMFQLSSTSGSLQGPMHSYLHTCGGTQVFSTVAVDLRTYRNLSNLSNPPICQSTHPDLQCHGTHCYFLRLFSSLQPLEACEPVPCGTSLAFPVSAGLRLSC